MLTSLSGKKKQHLSEELQEKPSKVFGRLGPDAYMLLTKNQLLDQAKDLVVKKRTKLGHRHNLAKRWQGSSVLF